MRASLTRSPAGTLAFAIGIALIGFQVWLLFEPQQPLVARPVHLAAALVLLFLYKPLSTEVLPRAVRIAIDTLLILGAIAVLGYYITGFERLTTRTENVSPVFTTDIVFGALLVFLLLEGSRRRSG